jgi:hypothetical protein
MARRLALPKTVAFLRDQLSVPREHSVRRDDGGDLLQRLPAELFADLHQRLALPVCQSHTARYLLAQHALLCHQRRVAQQEGVIHCTDDIRHNCFHSMRGPLRSSAGLCEGYGASSRGTQDREEVVMSSEMLGEQHAGVF